MLHSETFKVSNPYTTGGVAQWYSPCLGLWDLKIGSGIKPNGVRCESPASCYQWAWVGIDNSLSVGAAVMLPQKKRKIFKLLSWIYSPHHGSGTKGVLGYSTPWVMARGNGPWPFPRINDEGLPWWLPRSEKLKSRKVRPGGLLRLRTLEGNKQKIQHSANAWPTKEMVIYSFAMRTRK